jgi:hypothetical protein
MMLTRNLPCFSLLIAFNIQGLLLETISVCSHRCHSRDLVFGVKFVDDEDWPSVLWDVMLSSLIQTCRDLSNKHSLPIFSWKSQKAVIIPLVRYVCG